MKGYVARKGRRWYAVIYERLDSVLAVIGEVASSDRSTLGCAVWLRGGGVARRHRSEVNYGGVPPAWRGGTPGRWR